MKQICVIGVGYVGLVTAACFSDLGNRVIALDVNEERVAGLKQGKMPIYEPGLKELVLRNMEAGRLQFTTSYEEAMPGSDFVFICVGTPMGMDGKADLQYVHAAATSIAKAMQEPTIVINKSTVPVGTGDYVSAVIHEEQDKDVDFAVVSCPEFLREGSAIGDFMHPHRTVLGSANRDAADKVAQLHLPLRAPIVITDIRTAEMIKYASNAFLATKISFINEIANICEPLGADVTEVAAGMGYDERIGHHFLYAGLGYGGSCFPKDVEALAYMAEEMNQPHKILDAVMHVNASRMDRAVDRLKEHFGDELRGKTIGLLGLTFKPNTDDMRYAPSIGIAHELDKLGATVKGFDPVGMDVAAPLMPMVKMVDSAYEVATDCDAVVLCTEWNEFRNLDVTKMRDLMKSAVLFDGRNVFDPQMMRDAGYVYFGVGRGYEPVI